MASLRWSRGVRSRISTPSRWSSLVLDDSRLEAGGLDHDRFAVLVLCAHAHVDGPFDLDVDRRQAEAALLGGLLFL